MFSWWWGKSDNNKGGNSEKKCPPCPACEDCPKVKILPGAENAQYKGTGPVNFDKLTYFPQGAEISCPAMSQSITSTNTSPIMAEKTVGVGNTKVYIPKVASDADKEAMKRYGSTIQINCGPKLQQLVKFHLKRDLDNNVFSDAQLFLQLIQDLSNKGADVDDLLKCAQKYADKDLKGDASQQATMSSDQLNIPKIASDGDKEQIKKYGSVIQSKCGDKLKQLQKTYLNRDLDNNVFSDAQALSDLIHELDSKAKQSEMQDLMQCLQTIIKEDKKPESFISISNFIQQKIKIHFVFILILVLVLMYYYKKDLIRFFY